MAFAARRSHCLRVEGLTFRGCRRRAQALLSRIFFPRRKALNITGAPAGLGLQREMWMGMDYAISISAGWRITTRSIETSAIGNSKILPRRRALRARDNIQRERVSRMLMGTATWICWSIASEVERGSF